MDHLKTSLDVSVGSSFLFYMKHDDIDSLVHKQVAQLLSVKMRNESLLYTNVLRVRRNILVVLKREIQNEMSNDLWYTLTKK